MYYILIFTHGIIKAYSNTHTECIAYRLYLLQGNIPYFDPELRLPFPPTGAGTQDLVEYGNIYKPVPVIGNLTVCMYLERTKGKILLKILSLEVKH